MTSTLGILAVPDLAHLYTDAVQSQLQTVAVPSPCSEANKSITTFDKRSDQAKPHTLDDRRLRPRPWPLAESCSQLASVYFSHFCPSTLRPMRHILSPFLLAVWFVAVTGAGNCSNELDCSLNGFCISGECKCDKPWSGSSCGVMGFQPISWPQGYGMAPNATTWGGGVIFDGKEYHMFVSRMTNDCPLSTWTKNSRIDHAVSKTVTGPYTLRDVVSSSNIAAPLRPSKGSQVGSPTPGCQHLEPQCGTRDAA